MSFPTFLSAFPATTPHGIDVVRRIEELSRLADQVEITTHHVIHAGIYSRTICIPAGKILTGALLKVPTTLVICGKASVLIGDGDEVLVDGYHVLACAAGRKQAFISHSDTWLTMSFKTDAKTVDAAEREFTDEADMLASHLNKNIVIVTGE